MKRIWLWLQSIVFICLLVCREVEKIDKQQAATRELVSRKEVASAFQEHQGRAVWDAQSRKSWIEPS